MTRHGIVIPLPGLIPPPECKGGPAFCAICNAEMIDVETIAMRLAARDERRYSITGIHFDALWQTRGYRRNAYRQKAIDLISEGKSLSVPSARKLDDAERRQRKAARDVVRQQRPEVKARRKMLDDLRKKNPDVIAKRKTAYANRTEEQKERARQRSRERRRQLDGTEAALAKRRAYYAGRSEAQQEKRRQYERERYRRDNAIPPEAYRAA